MFDNKQRFSIKKLTIGVVSVFLGFSFAFANIEPSSAQDVKVASVMKNNSLRYNYLNYNDLTATQKAAIIKGTPEDLANSDKVYYFVYKPNKEFMGVLPQTGTNDEIGYALLGTGLLVLAVGINRNKKKVTSTLLVLSIVGTTMAYPLKTYATDVSLENYNKVISIKDGNVANAIIEIPGYTYVGYFTTDNKKTETSNVSDKNKEAEKDEVSIKIPKKKVHVVKPTVQQNNSNINSIPDQGINVTPDIPEPVPPAPTPEPPIPTPDPAPIVPIDPLPNTGENEPVAPGASEEVKPEDGGVSNEELVPKIEEKEKYTPITIGISRREDSAVVSEEEIINTISDVPSGVKYQVYTSKIPNKYVDGQPVLVSVTVTYSDGSVDTVNVPITITKQPDNEKYEPEAGEVKVSETTPLTNSNILDVVEVPNMPEGTKTMLLEGIKLPTEPGTYNIPVEVVYSDGTKDTINVPVTIEKLPEKHKPNVIVTGFEKSNNKKSATISYNVTDVDATKTTLTAKLYNGDTLVREMSVSGTSVSFDNLDYDVNYRIETELKYDLGKGEQAEILMDIRDFKLENDPKKVEIKNISGFSIYKKKAIILKLYQTLKKYLQI